MRFIRLRTFDNYVTAHIVLGRLQEEGINCRLKDENFFTLAPVFSNAFGGIKLMVAESQAERAEEILNNVSE